MGGRAMSLPDRWSARGFETMTRAIHAHDKHGIADAMLLYDNPNDPKVHEGLRRRRREERAMFLNGH
jgi:GH24 family phage-related lysozyme (muramidase)